MNMKAVEVTIQNLIGSVMNPKTENDPYLGFVYTSFQERATKVRCFHFITLHGFVFNTQFHTVFQSYRYVLDGFNDILIAVHYRFLMATLLGMPSIMGTKHSPRSAVPSLPTRGDMRSGTKR